MNTESPAAEYALVGCVLAHSTECLPEVCELTASDFWDVHCRAAWDAIRSLASEGVYVDAITVADRLMRSGAHGLMDGGPQVWTIACMTAAPIVQQVSHYAAMVRDAATKRRLKILCAELLLQADGDSSADACLANARAGIGELETKGASTGPISAADAMGATLDAIEARRSNPEGHAIMTGLGSFDTAIGGLKRGQLVIVAGPPGMGKTAWGVNVACYNAVERAVPTLVVSLEMDVSEVLERFLSQTTSLPGHEMANGKVAGSRDSMKRLYAGAKRVSAAPLWVEDRPLRLGKIIGEIRRWYARRVTGAGHPMGLVIVDYLGLIVPDEDNQRDTNRANAVAHMTRSFKMLAKDLKSPLVLLSQLNRQYTQTDRPQISQLRDSGAIEQDANMIIFPWREMPRDEMGCELKNEPGPAEWIVGKNRNGPIGTVACWWQADLMKFIDDPQNNS